jgi:hypothetical protein
LSETLRVPAPATPALLRGELKAGSLRIVGRGSIDGTAAIELSVFTPSERASSFTLSEKLWVGASSYLPIRRVLIYEPKPIAANAPSRAFPETGGEDVQNYKFLSSTPANLALLDVTVPRGLKVVPAAASFATRSCSVPFGGGPTTNGK